VEAIAMSDTLHIPPDELHQRLASLGLPRDVEEARLMKEAWAALKAGDQSRADLREFYMQNPSLPGTYFLESIARHRGLASGVIFALEVLRGLK
jgi:hypothetical protein